MPSITDIVRCQQRGLGYDAGWYATNATAVTDSTGVVVKAAPGTGYQLAVTDIVITNAGSGAGVAILNETSAAGNILWKAALAAGNTTPQQVTVNFRKPLVLGENKSLWLTGYTNSSLFVVANGFTIPTNSVK